MKKPGYEISRNGKRQTRARLICPKCGLKAWAKPTARLLCITCKKVMKAAS